MLGGAEEKRGTEVREGGRRKGGGRRNKTQLKSFKGRIRGNQDTKRRRTVEYKGR